ncbi:MAG: Glutamate racemase [Parcubacteria group bacterium GW2011_GWA2_43_11]|nr:MAG: Glutamate racemase [Parcubacteria group bacterium GW2011_GWA2_43_11]
MIGVFDSGSGGLTVLKALRRHAPRADVVYFGDLKNAPYGNRGRDELDVFTAAGMRTLLRYGATEIVSACNSVAVSTKRTCEDCDIPYASSIEMVGPTVDCFMDTNAKVLVLATVATIDSAIYQSKLEAKGIVADGIALPNLVKCIEEGRPRDVMTEMIRTTLRAQVSHGYSHIILGCTHFPLVQDVFEEVLASMGIDAVLVDPAQAVAQAVARQFTIEGDGTTRILVSAESPIFESFVRTLFPEEAYTVEVV